MNHIPTTIKNKKLVEKRREQIVLAAIQLFSQKGFHKTTLRELAQEAGLSYGNIYDYIGSKEDIFFLIHDYAAGNAMKALEASINNLTDPVEKLRRIVRAEFNLMDKLSDAILLIYQESHILSKTYLHKLLHKERKHLELIERAIEESVQAGQLRKCNTRITANLIKSMIDSWVIKRWDLRGHADRLETEKLILELIFTGLLTSKHPQKSFDTSMDLQGKNSLIVNFATPIGTVLCKDLISRGVRLAVHSEPANISRENPATCDINSGNLSFFSKSQYGPMSSDLFTKIESDMGQIDIYIHELGIGSLDLNNSNSAEPISFLESNLRAAKEIADHLCMESDKKTPNNIVYIAPWSWDKFNDSIHFEIVKAGIIALTKSLADKLAPREINVNCIVPGFIRTTRPSNLEKQFKEEMLVKIPRRSLGEIDDVSAAVRFLTSDSAKYITGQVINVSGGMF